MSDAQQDLEFYTRYLGLRLVKRTINFDNHFVYHFYYGNESGTPGTIMTTFPYKGMGVPEGVKGAGQIGATAFSVPADSLDFWRRHLRASGAAVTDVEPRFGAETIAVADPSGLVLELVATPEDPRAPWVTDTVGSTHAIRGVHSVALQIRAPARTLEFMQEALGFTVVNESATRTRVAINGDRPGHVMDIVHATEAPPARNGLGTVHHVAMAIDTEDEQLRMRQQLIRLGHQVTEVLDRQYFRSIYFREPGGVLFEIATIPPGFTVDETIAGLGQELKLPPWEESNRTEITARLPKVS